jgi:hypothetical protein
MTETRPEFHSALHQAGHAVVAHVTELPFGHVSLDADPQSLGHLLHGGEAASTREGSGRTQMAAVSVAGPLAVEMYAGTVPSDPELDPPDRWVTGGEAEPARAKAKQILQSCWPAVTTIADMLITRERVTSSEVAAVVRSTAPEMEHPVPFVERGVPGIRRPKGAADSEDHAESMPEGALVGGIEEGGGD